MKRKTSALPISRSTFAEMLGVRGTVPKAAQPLAVVAMLTFVLVVAFGLHAWLAPDFALAENPTHLMTADEKSSESDDSQGSDDSESSEEASSYSSDSADDGSEDSSSDDSSDQDADDEDEVGGFFLRVVDADMADRGRLDDDGLSKSQGDTSFAGMKFNVYKPNGKLVKTLTVGENGRVALAESDYLPLGKYTVKLVAETAQALGFKANSTWVQGQQVNIDDPYELVDAGTCACEIVRGGIRLNVVDSEMYDVLGVESAGQGKASLEGAVFEVYNASQRAILMGDTLYNPYVEGSDQNQPIMELTTDEWGEATTDGNTGVFNDKTGLPWGTYIVKQKEISKGYRADEESTWSATVQVYGEDRFGLYEPVRANVIRGGVKVQAADAETADGSPQGDAKLKGLVFEVVNDNGENGTVVMDGKAYGEGDVLLKLTTNKDGLAASEADALPYGTYKVRMAKSNRSYARDKSWEATITVKKNGKKAGLGKGKTFGAKVVRGGVAVTQLDEETQAPVEGATIEVVNASKQSVVVKGIAYEPGKVVLTISPDEKGVAETAANVLPYGTYTLRESQAAEGYQLDEDWTKEFQIRKAKKIVDGGTAYAQVIPSIVVDEADDSEGGVNPLLIIAILAVVAALVGVIAVRMRRRKEQELMEEVLPKVDGAAADDAQATQAMPSARLDEQATQAMGSAQVGALPTQALPTQFDMQATQDMGSAQLGGQATQAMESAQTSQLKQAGGVDGPTEPNRFGKTLEADGPTEPNHFGGALEADGSTQPNPRAQTSEADQRARELQSAHESAVAQVAQALQAEQGGRAAQSTQSLKGLPTISLDGEFASGQTQAFGQADDSEFGEILPAVVTKSEQKRARRAKRWSK